MGARMLQINRNVRRRFLSSPRSKTKFSTSYGCSKIIPATYKIDINKTFQYNYERVGRNATVRITL